MKRILLIISGLLIISLSAVNAQFQPIDAAYDPANANVNNNEPSIAVNPNNSQNILVATNYRIAQLVNGNTVYVPGQLKIGLYYTNNSGASWNSVLLSGNISYSKYADPSVAFRTDGTAFCSYLGINDASGEDQKSTLFVDKITGSEEGPLTVAHYAVPSLETKTHDKPYLHIDRNSTGIYRDRVYVSYSENDQLGADNTNKLMFTYLNETMGVFVNPVPINIPAETYHVSGSVPCTDKQGNIYVAFYTEDIQTQSPSIKMVKSTNGGGAFFSLPDPAPVIKRIGDLKDGLLSVNGKKFRVKNFPSIAIDGSNGQNQNKIYVVYADQVAHGEPGEPSISSAEVMFVKSSDGGNSWSNPVIISRNINAENFFPWISVSDNGIISVVYYELTGNSIIPKFLMSADGGGTFLDAGISDSFNLDGCIINNFIGDYIGVAAVQDKAVAVWTSTKLLFGQKPEICKIAMVPYEFPVLVKNDIPANISTTMRVDGNTYTLQPSGLTLQLSPFVSHTFEIIDEVYPTSAVYYKFRNWNNESYSKLRTINARELTFMQNIVANYKLAYPIKITSYLEGGSGLESIVKWTSPNYTHDYPVASGSTFYAFSSANNQNDVYSISVPNIIDTLLGTRWKFLYWNDGSTNPQKLNLQISNSLDFIAYYKGNLRSNTSTSFVNSSQRKFIRTPDGSLHMVYESMGYVWYERSTNDGSSWELMNDGKPISSTIANSPAIDYSASPNDPRTYTLGVVYQGSQSIILRKITSGLVGYQTYGITYSAEQVIFSYLNPENKDAMPVISYNGFGAPFMVVWKDLRSSEGEDDGFFGSICYYNNMGGLITSPVYIPGINSNSVSTHPCLASNKLGPDSFNYSYFHLAWEDYASSSVGIINYARIKADYHSMVCDKYNPNISSGSGMSKNSMPSMIVGSDNNNGVRLAWIGDNNQGQWSDVFRGMFSDGTWNPRFWKFGSRVISQSLNLGSDGYFLTFSEFYYYNVCQNRFTDSRTLSNIYTLNTTGRNVQLNNDAGGTSRKMFVMSFNNTAGYPPLSFEKSNSIGSYYGLYKENSKEISGRSIVLRSDSFSEFYFSLQDVSVDGKPVKFMEVSDSLRISDVNGLNKYMITEPFTLTDNSKFLFSLNYGVTDSARGLKDLGKERNISYAVDLIDEEGKVLQSLNKINLSKDCFLKNKETSFQVNPRGIGNKTVRMRLRTNVNFNAECFLVDSHSVPEENSGMYKTSEIEKIDYIGEKAIREFAISRNYPNPFNPSTVIDYQVPKTSKITLKIFDMLGKEVATLVNEIREMGRYSVKFDAKELPSGTYIYEIRANDFVKSGKMVLLK